MMLDSLSRKEIRAEIRMANQSLSSFTGPILFIPAFERPPLCHLMLLNVVIVASNDDVVAKLMSSRAGK